ncbi:MAG: hypothetical protein ChlgKO_12480 [Chlamydiales bacterium]
MPQSQRSVTKIVNKWRDNPNVIKNQDCPIDNLSRKFKKRVFDEPVASRRCCKSKKKKECGAQDFGWKGEAKMEKRDVDPKENNREEEKRIN